MIARRRVRQEAESQRERGSEASLGRTRLLESSEIVLRKFLGRCLLDNSDHFLIAAELRGEKTKQKKQKKNQAKKRIEQHRKETRKKEKIVYIDRYNIKPISSVCSAIGLLFSFVSFAAGTTEESQV